MDVAISSRFSPEMPMFASSFPRARMPRRTQNPSSTSLRASLSSSLVAPSICGSAGSGFFSPKIRPTSLTHEASSSPCSRSVVTMVIPFRRGNAWEQPPPDLASYLYKNRIIYLGMSLVPSVTELMLAQFLYLQFEDMSKPVYLYINSTGTTKGGVKYGYETEAFAIYDVMRYMGAPVFTLCVGNAWGEAALLLAAGAKGNRAALPSSTIMIRQPISRAQGQASDVEILRKEIRNVKAELGHRMLEGLWSMINLPIKEVSHSPQKLSCMQP